MAKPFGHMFGLYSYLSEVTCPPQRGYNKAVELESGLRVSWNDERSDMGVHFVFSGSALRWYYGKNMDWYDVLARAKKYHGKASRIDLALDLEDTGMTGKNLCESALRAYKGKGRTPKFLEVSGSDGGWTKYIGSRASDKMLRIYNKGVEIGEKDRDYIRVELETKGDISRAVAWEFPDMDRQACISMAKTLIRGQADFDIQAWQDALNSEYVGLSAPQGRERDTFGWLIKQAAPALAKEIAKRPNEPVIDQFWNALRVALRERGIEA